MQRSWPKGIKVTTSLFQGFSHGLGRSQRASIGPEHLKTFVRGPGFVQGPNLWAIDEAALKQIPSAADGLMNSKRRRYFRCPVKLPVSLRTTSGDHLKCTSINVSSNGLALNTPTAQELGAEVHLVVELPTGNPIAGKGVVIWDDKHGKAGIHFQCNSPEMQSRLDSWLEDQSAKSGI